MKKESIMKKPLLTKLSETEVNEHLSLYNSTKLNDRVWTCPTCKNIHDRDVNASKNLEQCQTYTVLTAV